MHLRLYKLESMFILYNILTYLNKQGTALLAKDRSYLFCLKLLPIRTGTCLQLFANWRPPARCKLSHLIWTQFFYFVNKQVKVSNISKENQQMALVVCQCRAYTQISAKIWSTLDQPFTNKPQVRLLYHM